MMEYVFVHTNPTSMPQNKASIIISAYERNKIDWGIITGEEVRAALEAWVKLSGGPNRLMLKNQRMSCG